MNLTLTSFVLAVALTLSASAQAATILVFGQSGGTNFVTGNETAGVTTITAIAPSTITTLNQAAFAGGATFTLNATSTGPATNVVGDLWQQPYDGSFSGVTLGLDGGGTLIFGAAQPPGSLLFTSSVPGMPLDFPTAMALSFTNAFPEVSIVGGSFGDFTSNVSGTFSAEVTPVPEPASMLLLGTGLLAVARRVRRRP
jgi:hypothetical protein